MNYYHEKQDQTVLEMGVRVWEQKGDKAGYTVRAHVHDDLEFLYVTKGSFLVMLNDNAHDLVVGDLILCPSNAVHSVIAKEDGESAYSIIKIRPSLLFDLAQQNTGGEYVLQFTLISSENTCIFRESDPKDAGVMKALRQLLLLPELDEYGRDLAGKIYAASFLLEILYRWRSTNPAVTNEMTDTDGNLARQMYRAVSYVNTHYAEPITAATVAAAIHMSYSYFSRTFSRIIGKNFKEYLNDVRLSHAESILLTTEKSVTEVSNECGYDNVSYFIALYKEKKGLTPSIHREKAKESEHSENA